MKINQRGLISLFIAFSFIISAFSGIILYFAPPGRIAYWNNWTFLGLTKTDWTNLHIIFCFLFVVGVLFHLYLNWKVFWGYIYSKVKKTINLKVELVLVSLIILISFFGSLKLFPPYKYLIDLSDYLKKSWVKSRDYEPPFGHAELFTFREFTQKMGIPLQEAVNLLKERGIKVDSVEETLLIIAQKNKISPGEIYRTIKPLEKKDFSEIIISEKLREYQTWTREMVLREFEGSGLGMKTLYELCQEFKLEPNYVRYKLEKKGYDVKLEETLKEVAQRYRLRPIEMLVLILEGEKKEVRK